MAYILKIEGGFMLQINNLSIYLLEDLRPLLEDFTFSLNKTDKVALIGEEGNGKSILLKAIYDKNLIEDICSISGEIFSTNEKIAYLPQTIDEEILEKTTEEYLQENISYEFFDYNLYYKLIGELNFDEDLISTDKYISTLSGGERIKYILLVELMKSPTIILMDEPSNDLDLDSAKWLENFMKNLDIPLIFISHDIELLSKVANRIIHLEQIFRRSKTKHTIVSMTYQEYVEQRSLNIFNQTKQAKKDKEEFDKKISRYRRIHDSVQDSLRATKPNNPVVGKNLKDKMHTVKAMGKILEKEKENLTKIPDYEEEISIDFDENIKVPHSKVVLDLYLEKLEIAGKILSKNINLKVIGPEKICITGKNGVGKSTLLKMIKKELEDLNLNVGYMPQTYFELEDYEINAIEYLSNDFTKDEHSKISTYLGSLNFKREEMYRNIKSLSGGQKAKLFFAKMNLDKCEVLVLDEPTRNLSPLSQPEIINALKLFKGSIISVSHDRNFINEVCDKCYELTKDGLLLID